MNGFADFMDRVVTAVGALETLLVSIAFVSGLIAIAVGVRKLASSAANGVHIGNRERAIGASAIVGGSLLLALPAFAAALGLSVFAETTPQPSEIFAYAPDMLAVMDAEPAREVLIGCLVIVQIVGAIALYRALTLFMRAPYHPGGGLYGRAITHLVGGTLAWNIVLFTGSIETLVLG